MAWANKTQQKAAPPESIQPRGPDPIVVGVPHGGDIASIAITDEADAAITTDNLGAVRLWPTLDGSRQPVVVAAPSPPGEMALVHDGRDLVAALLDDGGAITLMRLGADGSVRGHAQLTAETEFEEIVGVGNQFLARTDDHAIELYSADGARQGRLEAGHGERVTDLVARRGRAAAVVATDAGHELRWLGVEETLRWQISIAMPLEPRPNMVAIAPTSRRIAFVDVAMTNLYVFDAALAPIPVSGPALKLNEDHRAIGFIDDETVGVAGTSIAWWTSKPRNKETTNDPWATPPDVSGRVRNNVATMPGAFGDARLVSPHRLALAISDTSHTQYLGWKQPTIGPHHLSADQVVLSPNSQQFTWLDADLNPVRDVDLAKGRAPSSPWRYGQAIGPRHLLVQTSGDQSSSARLDLVDADKPDAMIRIGEFPRMQRFEVNDGMLAVILSDRVRRFRIDLEAGKAIELLPARSLDIDSVSWVRIFDPERAGGKAALVLGWENVNSEGQTLWTFEQKGKRLKKTRHAPLETSLIRSDAAGRLVMLDNRKSSAIVTMQGDQVESRIEIERITMPIGVDLPGGHFAAKRDHDVVVLDRTGKELWHKTVWGAHTLIFVDGGKRLVVGAPGGFISYDAASGAEMKRTCGLEFGLYDKEIVAFGSGQAPVCENLDA
jgi:hypothetical protein